MWNCVFYYYYIIISVIIVILIPLCKYLRSRVSSTNIPLIHRPAPSHNDHLHPGWLVMKIEEKLVLPIRQPCDFFYFFVFLVVEHNLYLLSNLGGKSDPLMEIYGLLKKKKDYSNAGAWLNTRHTHTILFYLLCILRI